LLLNIAEIRSSSYYDALSRDYVNNLPQPGDESIVNDIKDIRNDPEVKDPDGIGYRPMTKLVNDLRKKRNEPVVNNKRILRVMRQNDLLSTSYNKKVSKYSSFKGEGDKHYKNHISQRFQTDRPVQKVGTDVTEIRWGKGTINERLFLSVFEDFYSGEVLSYSMSLHPNTDFINESLQPVLDMSKPVPYLVTIHSDQGIQYQVPAYRRALKKAHVRQSMSRKSTPHDNAPTESLIHQLKVGTVLNHKYATRSKLELAIKEYIHYYNYKRIRKSNNWMTPIEMRKAYTQKAV